MPSTSRIVTGLTNGTEYTFRVAAVNHTRGDFSDPASATPSSEPASLTVVWSGGFNAAGDPAGTYLLSGQANGRPTYYREWDGPPSRWIYWESDDSQWRLRAGDFVYASNSSDTATPPAGAWSVNPSRLSGTITIVY